MPRESFKRALKSEKFRFLVAGAFTTACSYGIYAIFLAASWEPRVSYGIAYALGIGLSYSVNSLWVFRQPWTWRALLTYPLVYGAQFIFALCVFTVSYDWLGFHELIAPLATVVLSIPLTFVMGRFLIYRGSLNLPGDQKDE